MGIESSARSLFPPRRCGRRSASAAQSIVCPCSWSYANFILTFTFFAAFALQLLHKRRRRGILLRLQTSEALYMFSQTGRALLQFGRGERPNIRHARPLVNNFRASSFLFFWFHPAIARALQYSLRASVLFPAHDEAVQGASFLVKCRSHDLG